MDVTLKSGCRKSLWELKRKRVSDGTEDHEANEVGGTD